MRVSLLLSATVALAIGASAASAMDANEIFNRLKAQADASKSVQGNSGLRRGLAVSYGDEPEAATAVAPAASVVAIPSDVRPAAAPATYVSAVDPVSAPERLAAPAYTLESAPIEPSTDMAAPSFQPAPSYAQIPTFTQVEAPEAIPAAVSYSAVESDKRVDLRIYFEWNSASLKPEAIGQLAELCNAIRRVGAAPDNRFKIIGHTDKSGTDDYNLYLSNARAREVKRHLVEECALSADSLLAVGEGERQSLPSSPANAPEERRVEIQFVS